MRNLARASVLTLTLLSAKLAVAAGSASTALPAYDEAKTSPQTRECIECHRGATPGIVEDWLSSRHSRITPGDAVKQPVLARRVSAEKLPAEVTGFVVGCYECHSRNPDKHKDNFEHMGFKINVIVTPNDCSLCHPVEATQYAVGKKAHARNNLAGNPVYHTLVKTITGVSKLQAGKPTTEAPSEETQNETCFGCHGTKIEVKGMKTVTTESGEISVPVLSNWPNQGVGRENPDGSLGSCTACHPRHGFSIEVARKPFTCAQCHLEPDVPAWDVYKASKHGNIFLSKNQDWDFNAVPWVVGRDFKAPTCASCHDSLVVAPDGSVIQERTHDFGARLWVRLFGLIYSHPQPKSGDTSIIRNNEGLPLPTSFTGEMASAFLIDQAEQQKRQAAMQKLCTSCHSSSWTAGHFAKLDRTITETNAMTLAATLVLVEAWDKGLADKANPFDEPLEQLWVKQWLFYSNSIRYASAMGGAHDYASFENGWWELTHNLAAMREMVELKSKVKGAP